MMRLNSDLTDICNAALDGKLDQIEAEWDSRVSVGVVLAAGGYPFDYAKGSLISGLPESDNLESKVFHAGTKQVEEGVVTAGGRVLCACALGNSVSDAQKKAYELTAQISWDNVYYRTDIGYRAIARENS
jgi:phosphoribosylamine--glycine ligase